MENQNHLASSDEMNEGNEAGIVISRQKMMALKALVTNLKQASDALTDFLSGMVGLDPSFTPAGMTPTAKIDKVIEGVFDGEKMVGSDGHQYAVPVNYASKSKLVEGDLLKLSITEQGALIYKQIQPIDRIRLTGLLEQAATGEFAVNVGGKHYRVLGASVTYFKGDAGDETVILVPKTGQSRWAAVEHIFKKA